MKTNTFLRLSLLIPLLVWIGCLVFLLIVNAIPDSSALAIDETNGISELVFLFLGSYVFGIIVWLIPYILLSLILFFWSFIGRAQTALKVYALSPLAMMVLTLAALNILTLGTARENALFSGSGIMDQDFINLNLLGTALSLGWGYICVGIGFGIYKLLQRRGMIRDDQNLRITPATNQPV